MVWNFLKPLIRSLWRYKTFSLINISGLSIGLASSFIIMLYAVNSLSYDHFNTNLENVYLAVTEHAASNWTEPYAPHILGPTLKSEYPEVEQVARCLRLIGCLITYKDKEIDDAACVSSDPAIFNVLTLPLVSGNLRELSTERNYAVISSEMARKMFGTENPLGEIITVKWKEQSYNLKVSAVMKALPKTSTLIADVFVPLFIAEDRIQFMGSKFLKDPLKSWRLTPAITYVLLANPRTHDQLENTMASFSKSHFDTLQGYRFHLFPLKDMYLHGSKFIGNTLPKIDITNLYVYPAVAILTLLIACINFVILSTGRASVRTKEVAVRKVVGATRFDLMKQIMLESVFVSALSLPLALLLVEVFLPSLSQLLGEKLQASDFHRVDYLLLLSGITLVAGVLSGSYVSFYLSGFRPMDILRSKISTGASKPTLRMIMIGVQMMIFIGLITASMTIYRQVLYFHNMDMGLDKNDLLVLNPEKQIPAGTFETFKAELKSEPSIISVTGTYNLPGTNGGLFSDAPDKLDPSMKIHYQIFLVDRDFIETMNMRMASGKSFAEATAAERKNACIINEAGIRAFGIADVSRELFNGRRILGVVKDFNSRSLREEITPIVINCNAESMFEIAVRLRHTTDLPRTVSFIERMSMPFNNGKPMGHQFFDERLDGMYSNDYRFAEMIGYFTALAIFIACLGLFGVSLFVNQTRMKEIGIRKVMGASVGTIFYLMAREYVVMALAATVIAMPISIHFINRWLQNYAYKVSVDVLVVIYALLSAIVIVLLTIGYQVIRAAKANPIEALRCE